MIVTTVYLIPSDSLVFMGFEELLHGCLSVCQHERDGIDQPPVGVRICYVSTHIRHSRSTDLQETLPHSDM